jgi:hypothetical protein
MLIDFLVPVYMAMAGLTAVLLAAVTTLAYRVGRLPTHSDLHRVRDEIRQEVGEQTAALRTWQLRRCHKLPNVLC